MTHRPYKLAVASIFALFVGLVETLATSFELYQAGMPQSWGRSILTGVSIMASLYALLEIRRLLRMLGRPSLMVAWLTIGFWGAALATVLLGILALRSNTLSGLLLFVAAIVPLFVLGVSRDVVTEVLEPDQRDLFQWRESEDRAAALELEVARLKENQADLDKLLRENPELASAYGLPLSARIRGSELP